MQGGAPPLFPEGIAQFKSNRKLPAKVRKSIAWLIKTMNLPIGIPADNLYLILNQAEAS
jgi:hypothetical protein